MTIRQIKIKIKALNKQLYKLTKKCTHKYYKTHHVITIDGMDTATLRICDHCGIIT